MFEYGQSCVMNVHRVKMFPVEFVCLPAAETIALEGPLPPGGLTPVHRRCRKCPQRSDVHCSVELQDGTSQWSLVRWDVTVLCVCTRCLQTAQCQRGRWETSSVTHPPPLVPLFAVCGRCVRRRRLIPEARGGGGGFLRHYLRHACGDQRRPQQSTETRWAEEDLQSCKCDWGRGPTGGQLCTITLQYSSC